MYNKQRWTDGDADAARVTAEFMIRDAIAATAHITRLRADTVNLDLFIKAIIDAVIDPATNMAFLVLMEKARK